MYRTIQDIIAHNRAINHHFFDKDTMNHWNSKVYQKVYEGGYFITYEEDDFSKGYTIRQCINGVIHSISRFKQYDTFTQAEIAIQLHA
jgi:hypothetical protein